MKLTGIAFAALTGFFVVAICMARPVPPKPVPPPPPSPRPSPTPPPADHTQADLRPAGARDPPAFPDAIVGARD